MKTKVLFSALSAAFAASLVTSTASASWFQTTCGNADGTTQILDGHNANGIVLTERVWGRGPNGREETKVELDRQDTHVETLEKQLHYKKENNGCAEDSQFGYYSSRIVSFQRVNITKNDGSTFSKDIVGVSQDGKSVEAFLICESLLTSQMPCKL